MSEKFEALNKKADFSKIDGRQFADKLVNAEIDPKL